MRSNREDIVTDRFLRILEWPSAVGLGGLIAFLFSLKRVNPEVQFEWNTWSLVVLVIGTFLSFLLIHHVMRPARSQARAAR